MYTFVLVLLVCVNYKQHKLWFYDYLNYYHGRVIQRPNWKQKFKSMFNTYIFFHLVVECIAITFGA